ncbi:MAG: hypothetical protein WAL45_10700 [Terracidiphilus sp.]
MQTRGTESAEKQPSTLLDTAMGVAMIPVLFVGACLAVPYTLGARWLRIHGEHKLRLQMKSRGRLMTWPEFVRAMHETGGTCIEEKFTAKGPVRFWWTPEDVRGESPHEIIDWFTMRKGRQYEPFVHWCRARYTSADAGSAILVDTPLVPRREIYALWSECRSDAMKANWVEVAPPEILPHKPGQ